jgi:hypothetical protein
VEVREGTPGFACGPPRFGKSTATIRSTPATPTIRAIQERRRRILGDARKAIRLFSPSWSG